MFIPQLWWPWVGIHILNCLNKFADLLKANEALLMIARFFIFSLIWCATKIFQPFPQGYFLRDAKQQTWLQIYVSVVKDTSSMRQKYINCQTLHRSSCDLTAFCIPSSRKNKISQTAHPLASHIYSTNVGIPMLWHDISRFFMHLFDKNILPMKHWKCKVCLHFWLLLCETGRHSNCFSYSTTGWASDRFVGVQTVIPRDGLLYPYQATMIDLLYCIPFDLQRLNST